MPYQLRKLYARATGPTNTIVCERSEFTEVWNFATELFGELGLNIIGCHLEPNPDETIRSAEFFVAAPGIHETYVIQST